MIPAIVRDPDAQLPPSVPGLCGETGCAPRRAQDFDVRAASAQIVSKRLDDFGFGRTRRTIEQRPGAHDHAVQAIAALRGLLLDKGFLHGIRMVASAEALECEDLTSKRAIDRNDAGTRREAVDQDGAGAAFAEPAAIFRSVQFEIVP